MRKQISGLAPATIANYCTWLRALDRANGGDTLRWVKSAQRYCSTEKPLEYFNLWWETQGHTLKLKYTEANFRAALAKFSSWYLSAFSGVEALKSLVEPKILAQAIASTALFPSKEVVEKVMRGELGSRKNMDNGGNGYASWDCCSSRRDVSRRGLVDSSGVRCDSNVTAGYAIKKAILASYFPHFKDHRKIKGYTACHIYPVPGDYRYYTCLPNLCLVPSALSSLTDHSPEVIAALRYHVYHLFKFRPEDEPIPVKPPFYDSLKWRKIP